MKKAILKETINTGFELLRIGQEITILENKGKKLTIFINDNNQKKIIQNFPESKVCALSYS